MISLPMDEHLDALLQLMETHDTALLTAEPGAGKTTRVPPALARAKWAQGRAVWVLQPRRLAALVAAWRVAEEQGGGEPGGEVGYHFRFDRKESKETRILFLTEGMFLRRLQAEPDLPGVAAVVLDEFHERSLDVDLGLALLRRLKEKRPDLKLLIMSATLDAAAVSAALNGCPVLACPGRAHPVEVSYLEQDRCDPAEPVERRAVRGLRECIDLPGDILVFLPGTKEIRRTAERLAGDPSFDRRRVLALHGQLSPQEQRRALEPADKPKIILATNVAETSLTVPGVRVVVDSTLTRRDAFNPYTGLSALVTLPASQASMAQRTGRAGREAPGRCLRLCSAAEFKARARYDEAELSRADLAAAQLQSLAAGYGALAGLKWLELPPPGHLEAADRTLRELGALDGEGALTPKGEALARAPLHPRLGALAWEARAGDRRESDELMAALALLNGERTKDPDFLTSVRRYEAQGAAVLLKRQLADWLSREAGRPAATQGPWERRLSRALLGAFPGQAAFSRQGTDRRGEARFILADGGEAQLRDSTFNVAPGYYLLLEILESRALGQAAGMPRVQSLLPLEAEWLLEAPPGRLNEEVVVAFDAAAGRIQARERLRYGVLVLDEGEAKSPQALQAASEALVKEARKAGLAAFCGEGQPARYLARRAYVLGARPDASLPGEDELWAEVSGFAEGGARSFEAIRQADPLRMALDRRPEARRLLEAEAPAKLRLPSGRETSIHYEEGKAPWVASRLQDFFGMWETPRLAGKPLTVHLLAPNQRPQQVTQDLAGFWEREYPRLRKELMRKYPRHAWPEDPKAPRSN